jgi:uncharacterized membrane protein YkvA (DUF1232 family)
VRAILVGVGVAAAVWILGIVVLYLAGRRTAAKELAAILPNVVFLFKGLLHDPRVARTDKILLVVGIVWVVSPIDLIPEFIPVVGPLDDVVVAALILRRVVRHAGPETLARHWRGDPSVLRRIVGLFDGRAQAA